MKFGSDINKSEEKASIQVGIVETNMSKLYIVGKEIKARTNQKLGMRKLFGYDDMTQNSGDLDKRNEWVGRDETIDHRSTSYNTIASASPPCIVCSALISRPQARRSSLYREHDIHRIRDDP
ncbi:hypothetical protein KQX54_021809 [Cotesia glomerata]|uniref:Uncharacterized protein n=1 Tax=Cotesia glomerata TaxID=32391 RepID=A0AAV7J831_COTGL|nr:hypothetical protein KQX54_021809 [Cotesia glomerata]